MDTALPVQQAKKRKVWPWIVLVFVIVAVIAGVTGWWLVGGRSGTPKKVATEWLTLLSTDQVDAAYGMTAKDFKEGTSADQFSVFLEAYPIMTHVKSVDFSGIERTASNGQSIETLSGELKGTDDSTSPVKMMLISEDGTWKIYNVDLRGL